MEERRYSDIGPASIYAQQNIAADGGGRSFLSLLVPRPATADFHVHGDCVAMNRGADFAPRLAYEWRTL